MNKTHFKNFEKKILIGTHVNTLTQAQSGGNGKSQRQENVDTRHAEINSQLEQCSKITQETETQLQKVCRLQEYMMITRSHLEVYAKLAENGQLSQEQRQQWQSEAAKHQEYENNLVSLRKDIVKNHEKIIGIMQDLHGQVRFFLVIYFMLMRYSLIA